ncbi:MAG: ribonuclease catalytic domain-containing protein [Gemmatimonadota bacterium]
MVHLLFEEDGNFRAGTVLGGTEASYQVELTSGRRSKVKASHVLLRFEQPAPAVLLAGALRDGAGIDLDFLWECAPQREFGFEEFARDYYGHVPSAVESAAILFRLHGAPVYFHRKGRGRFRPADPETLKAALAAVERKRQQENLKQQYVEALTAGSVPEAIARQAITLLVAPDRNGIEYKALAEAADAEHLSPLRLLLKLGAIASAYRWHLDSFTSLYFPRGTGFPSGLTVPELPPDLPLSDVEIVSIDDSETTEIDDGFSVQWRGAVARVGIHIAAPAVALTRGDGLDAIARARLSTVYAPGMKYTMLPQAVVDAFSLNEGRVVPVLSLYVDVDPSSFDILGRETRVERARVIANLRHDRLDELVTEERIAAASKDLPQVELLSFLWRFARVLHARREQVRGRREPLDRIDYSFVMDGEGERARVAIRPRRRGAPLDLIVAELMILANSTWGEWLAEQGRAGIYRSQALGRVRMSTTPAPHEGIGVDHYAWSSSPLRRYVDLVNQRQLVAAALGEAAPYATNDAELFAVVSAFDAAYTAYADFQTRMERYWCLRWVSQERITRIGATILKGEVVRLDHMPFVTRMPGLPALARGRRIEIDVLGADEVETTLELRLHRVLAEMSDEVFDADDSSENASGPSPDADVTPVPQGG